MGKKDWLWVFVAFLLMLFSMYTLLPSKTQPKPAVVVPVVPMAEWRLYHELEQRADSTELLATKEYLLILGVATSGKSPKFRKIRDTIRSSWMQWQRSDVLMLFFDARLSSMPFERAREYLKEYGEYGDIAFVPGDDNASDPRLGCVNKQLGWWEYVYRHYQFKYAVKLDDDVYVHVPRLADYVRAHLPRQECFAGRLQSSDVTLRSSFPRDDTRQSLECGNTDALVGQVEILSRDLVAWLGMNAYFPRWIRTPAGVVEDWALGCMMSQYKNPSGGSLRVTHLDQDLLAGVCAWINGKAKGLNNVLTFHMAGNFKHQQDDLAPNYFQFFHELFVQHSQEGRWNQALLTQFVSRPAFLSAVAGCRGQFHCGEHNCTEARTQIRRFVQEISQLNSNST